MKLRNFYLSAIQNIQTPKPKIFEGTANSMANGMTQAKKSIDFQYSFRLLTCCCVTLFSLNSFGQSNPLHITQSTPDSGNKDYVAQKSVVFNPGYSYTANNTVLNAWIAPLADYSDLFTNEEFIQLQINQSLEVGATPGSFGVGGLGDANYNIPFRIPQGTAGMQPNLSFAYSSLGGNGHLGVGWGISGLSSISLMNSVRYFDDETESVRLDGTDKFALDGTRLFNTAGAYGANNTTYGLEIDAFVQVISYGSGTTPDWFKVMNKDGITTEYGNSGDSKIVDGNGTALSWKINKIYDANGNYILFEYDNFGNDQRISKIRYTGNSEENLAPYNIIEFHYKERIDKNVVYFAGKAMNLSYLLDKVTFITNNQHFKEYKLSYGINTDTFLKSVQEFGANNEGLNSTNFLYGHFMQEQQVITLDLNAQSSGFYRLVSGFDFNKDGRTDLLKITRVSELIDSQEISWEILIANEDGFFIPYANGNIPPGFSVYNKKGQTEAMSGIGLGGDFNGDGKSDILLVRLGSEVINNVTHYFLHSMNVVLINSPNDVPIVGLPVPQGGYVEMGKFLHIGDFDGNGKDDILILKKPSPNNYNFNASIVKHSTNNNFGLHNVNVLGSLQFFNSSSSHFMTDMDGDGKIEIAGVYNNSTEFFEMNSNPPYSFSKIHHANFPNSNCDILTGDFNGDGLTDFFIHNNSQWSISYSNGKSLINNLLTNFNVPNNHFNKLCIYDADGNGKSDVVYIYPNFINNVASDSYARYYFSKGSSFEEFQQVIPLSDGVMQHQIGDFNGDGKLEIGLLHPNSYHRFIRFRQNSSDRYLVSTKDGFGLTTNISYDWLSKGNSYTANTNVTGQSTFPLRDVAFALPVVSRVLTNNGIGGQNMLQYHYEHLKVHAQGKGILGFAKTHVTNLNTQFKSTKEFSFLWDIAIDPKLRYTVLSKELTTNLNNNGSLVAMTQYNYNVIGLGGVRIRLQMSNSVANDYINDKSITTTMTYHSNGNLHTLTSNTNGYVKANIFNQYVTFGNWWFPGLIKTATTTNSRPLESPYVRTREFTYDNKGNMLNAIDDPGLPKSVNTNYQYDGFGNVKESTVSSSGLLTKNIKSTYDSQGRYITNVQNELGQITTIVTDNRWGEPLSVQDPTGLTVSFTYNGFGSLTSSTDPKGIITNHSRNWDITTDGTGNFPNNTLFRSTVNTPGSPTVKTWYDILGREVQSEMETPEGPVFTLNKYDFKGNIIAASEPYFSGDTPLYNETIYDAYNRPTEVISGPVTTTYSYTSTPATTTITTTSLGQTTSKTKNAIGEVISATDNGGTLTYNYFSSGNLKNVSLDGVQLTSATYDAYGRQTSLFDVNAGLTEYEYDAYGNLIYQKDADNNITTFEYDVIDRTRFTTTSDGILEYIYNTANNGLNELAQIIGDNGVNETFSYDMYHRLTNHNKTFDGVNYATTYQYDMYDRLIQMQYPSGYIIKNVYSNIGSLEKVTDNSGSVIIYEEPEYNHRGQLTKYKLGNGVETVLGYDLYGSLLSMVSGTVQNYELGINYSTGNISYRRDNIKDRQEHFTYDNLNRLKEIETSVVSSPLVINQLSLTYEDNGNIESKSDVGNYTYDQDKINAVVSVDNINAVIPSFNQTITMTPFKRTLSVEEGDYNISFIYDAQRNRFRSILTNDGMVERTKIYLGHYEKEITVSQTGSVTKEIHYIPTGNGVCAAYVVENGVGEYNYIYTDHLGSITALTDDSGLVIFEQNFDAWGKRRNANSWEYDTYVANPDFSWVRGFTGHEHHDEFGIINMNNRMYDPVIARMMGTDNYVQSPYFSQSYNRYSYVWNNPMSYTDPDGDWVQYIVGAVLGGYSGYKIGQASGAEGWRLFAYTMAGAGIGAATAGLSTYITTSGMAFAHTSAMMYSSFNSSVAFNILSNGQTGVGINFGAASYSLSSNEWSSFSYQNKWYQNLAYTLGGLANIQDGFAGFNGGSIKVNARRKLAGHSWIKGDKVDISVAPGVDNTPHLSGVKWEMQYLKGRVKGVYYDTPIGKTEKLFSTKLYNVKLSKLQSMTSNIKAGKNLLNTDVLEYGVYYGCVNQTARALLYSGVLNFNAILPITAPAFLNLELMLRNQLIYNAHHLIKYK